MSNTTAHPQRLVSKLVSGDGRQRGWQRGRGMLSVAVTAALVAGSVLVGGGVAAAATPAAQSQGQFLSGTVTGGNLANLASVAPASASAAPTTTVTNPLSVTALNSATVNLGGGVNLLGNNGILTLGAANQYATANVDGSSAAASGAVGNDGAIGIGADGTANPGIAPSNATLNLAPVIAGTPALSSALSAATVNIGPVAGTANETAAGVQSGTYDIGALSLDLTSPLVSNVYTTLNTTLGTTLTTLRAIPLVTGVPTASALLAPLTTISSGDGATPTTGSITANLQTGTVHIDVAKLIAGQMINGQPGNINNLPANTNLLPYITAGLTNELLPAITNAISGPTGVLQNITTQLSAVKVAGQPINATVLTPLLNTLTTAVNGTVSGLGTSVITPLANSLTGLVALTANVEPTPPNATPQVAYSKAPLTVGVVPTGDAASITLANATVGPNAGPAAAPVVPTASGLTPSSGPIAGGTTVTVTGTGFVPGATTVNVDGVNQPATATSTTTLTFVTPAHGIGAVPITVKTAGGTSSPALSFTYLAAPTIATVTGLSPNSGPVAGGTTVTVTGTGFVPGATTVNVDGVNQPATATSGTTLTFVTSAHAAGGVPVTVQTAGGTSSPAQTFTFVPVPTITVTGLSPNSGPVAGGTTVTVTGTGFVPGNTTVNVDGVNQTANATSTTTLTFVTPAHAAGPVDVTVQTAGGTSSPPRTFTFVPVPTIATVNGLSPNSGPVAGGTTVTVTGTGFVPGATTVNVDGVNQPATATSATTLTFVTPAHAAGPVDVTVQTAGGTSNAQTFTFLPVPTIDPNGLTPNSGPVAGGTTVTVTGTGFVPGATTVNVDGVNQPATATSATKLTFVTPAHAAGGVDVTVQTAGGISTPAQTFTFVPVPTITITGLSPNSGPVAGGTTVTVTGTGFVPGATTVNVDGINQPANATSTTTLTFVTPAHAAGGVDVTAQTAGGTSSPPRTFTFVPVPTIATVNGLSPISGPVAGGTTVTVTGTGFVPGATSVNVDGVNQPATATSDTTLTFVTPAHAAGPVGVTVQTAGGTSTPAQTFTFQDVPTVTALSPDHGPVAGGTTVTITGTGFSPTASVVIDGVTVPATVVNDTTLTFVTPAHAGGQVPVTVTTTGGTSTPALPFTFGPPTIATIGGLSPNSGPVAGGTTVTVTGTGFVVGGTTVNVDGVNQSATATSTTTLTFVTPAHTAGPVDVSVQTAAGASNANTYTFLAIPTETLLNPDSGPIAGGTTVTVTGTGFVPGATLVFIDSVPVVATVTSPTSLTFTTPAHAAGAVDVTVQTNGGTSSPALPFTYLPVPTIATTNGLSPNSGPVAGNTTVTVTGTGFVPGATTVNVDGVNQAANATSATTLTFVTPAHAVGPVDVTVQTAGGTSGAQTFTYVAVPTISAINGLSPNSGPVAGNTTVTVTGTGFVVGATTVNVDGVNQTANATSATTLTFVTPAHAAGPVDVTVQTAGGTSAPKTYTFLDVPTATLLSPDSGPVAGNTTVTVTGSGFVAGATLVYVDSSPVVATVTSPTTLTFSTPAHAAGTVEVTVQTNGGTSSPALPFTYLPVPTATSLTPTSGPVRGNTPVTITGTGFVPGGTTVTIGGITVPAGSVTIGGGGTTATFATPAHAAGQVGVVVTTAGGGSTPALAYTYVVDPNAASLTPTSGPVAGGTTVTITGTGFVAGATSVTIGGTAVPAGDVTVSPDGTTASFDTPAHAAGLVSVVATTAGGSTTTPLGFTYVDIPTTTSLSPTSGPVAGGTTVTITGTAFVQGGTTVTIGGTTVPATAVTVNGAGTTAMFSTPAHAAGTVTDVVVTTVGGASTPALSFTYLPVPTAASLTPTSGPTAGNTPVTITGTGFVPGATTVTIGAITVPAANVTVSPDGTTAMFATPRVGTAGTVNVVATTAGGSTTPPLLYTYLNIPGAASLSPTSGPVAGGTTVTITGTDFVPGATSVTIGGITVPAANVTVNIAGTKATFLTPAHVSGGVSVVATTPGGSSTPSLGFTYLDIPTATSLSPTSGPVAGGTTVTITGTGFVPGATSVTIGGATVAAADVTVNGAGTSAMFATPAHAAGTVNDVVVTTAGGTSTPALSFTYLPVPTAASLTPTSGPTAGNTPVTITGTGFVPGATTVTIGGNTVTATGVTVSSDGTTAKFATPAHAAGVVIDVAVTTAGGTTAPLTYTYLNLPGATSLTPTFGPVAGGTSVAITGSGFVDGATSVTIGGNTVPVGAVTVTNSGTTATFLTPAHPVPGVVDVTATTAGGATTLPMAFTYLAVPTATSLTPTSGPVAGNTQVIITGTGFVPDATTVTIGGKIVAAGDVTVSPDGTTAKFATPAHAAGPVNDVAVTTAGGVSTPGLKFTYVPVPTATSLTPVSGPITGNTPVTITGSGFVVNGTTITIGGNTVVAANVSVSPDGTTASFSTPAVTLPGAVNVAATTAGGSTAPLTYTYLLLPGAATLAPTSGPVAGGTPVTITGSGFVAGQTSVTIGGNTVAATVGNGGTTATFVTPAHAAGLVTVVATTTGVGSTVPLGFTYLAVPTVSGLTPTSGPVAGGTKVTITGTGFVAGATTVRIGGNTVAASGVMVTSSTTATFLTPAHVAGLVSDVSVTTPGGTSTPARSFTYVASAVSPRATSLSPDHGPTTGNTLVTVTGTGFVVGGTSVTIDGVTVPAALVTVNAARTTATFRTPAHAPAGVLVTVKTSGGTSNPLGYLYEPVALAGTSCVLTGVDPATGLDAATVNVLANVGVDTQLVPSLFSVLVGSSTAGTPTKVTPLAGGFLMVSTSVPVAQGTRSVSYRLAPQRAGVYTPVTGAPIPCTTITDPQAKAGIYFPLTPARVLDTRHSLGATQSLAPGATITLPVLGKGGIPATGVASVVLNMTVTAPATPGYLTVYPGSGSLPNTSSINFAKGQTVANLVPATVGSGGNVKIYNGSHGTVDVIADVAGYFSSGQTVAPGSYVPVAPTRLLDTSNSIGTPGTAYIKSGATVRLKVTGVAGVPATNVSAVTLNVTAAEPTTAGFVTVYPSTEAKPFISSLNFGKGTTDANLVITPVGTDGTVTLYNGSKGTVRLVADISGFFRGGVAVLNGEYRAVSPSRILDTRSGVDVKGKVPGGGAIAPAMVGRNMIPTTGVSAVIFNLTVTSTTAPGFATAYPNTLPLASNVNFVAKQDQPNAVISPVGSGGKIHLYNGSKKPVDLVADVFGYFIKR